MWDVPPYLRPFCWAVGSYSSSPPAAWTLRTKSTVGFYHPDRSPCTSTDRLGEVIALLVLLIRWFRSRTWGGNLALCCSYHLLSLLCVFAGASLSLSCASSASSLCISQMTLITQSRNKIIIDSRHDRTGKDCSRDILTNTAYELFPDKSFR